LTRNETGLTSSHTAVTRATTIDSRVGCLLDGAVLYFEDGHKTPCGPRWGKGSLSVGNHVTVLQLVRGPTSALGRWNPVEQTGLCIYSCFRTCRLELFNRVLSNQPTKPPTQLRSVAPIQKPFCRSTYTENPS
jgi:hypothetical protein